MYEKIRGQQVTEHIYLCPDGKYRWYYEFPMMKNPTLLYTVWKVLALAFFIVWLLIFLISLGDAVSYGFRSVLKFTGAFLLLFLFFMGLGLIAYIFLAAVYGWKYIVLFEMDEKEIVHIQMPKQFDKAQAVGWLTALAGLAGKSLPAMGAGMLAASKNSSTSVFADVKEVKGVRQQHTIRVNQMLNRNQVYADDPDYDFVWNFITGRCPQAKIH